MSDIRHASKEFLTRFIEIYKSHPALWKVKSKEYANRNLKNAGYDALVEFYRKVDPKADRDFVAKKIQSLRGSFRKELKKFVKSRKSGASSDDHYVPSLWYFDLLSFTWEDETPSEGVDTTMDSPSSQTDDNLDADNPDTCLAQVNEPHDEEHESQASNTKIFKLPAKRIKRRLNPHESERREFMKVCTEALKQPEELSDSAAFGKFVASKHAKMSDVQKMYAESLITNILNNGVLNRLTEHTAVCEMQVLNQNVYRNSRAPSDTSSSLSTVFEETKK